MKRIVALILAVTLLLSFAGCGKSDTGNSNETQIKSANLAKDIIGSWNANDKYMTFFDNGYVGNYNADSGKGSKLPYAVKGDTVTIHHESGDLVLTSVEVKDGTLNYISPDGHFNRWDSISDEEMLKIMK